MSNFVVAIVGPTACGKTALSVELAKQFNAQIICCDSRTVYRHMDIGTAKPTAGQRQGIPHHMLDLVEPDQPYTAARYKNDADNAITTVQNEGGLPIICGGSGLYFKAALEGLRIPQVPPDAELRQSLNELADRNGNSALHTKLAKLDSIGAKKIHANDRFRLVRALEVSLTTGQPFSHLAGSEPSSYDVLWIGLAVKDRSILQTRIHTRLQAQMKDGLLTEVRDLHNRYGDCNTLMNSINYSEFIAYLTGQMSLAAAEELCLKNNYQLARRQIMWFRRNKDINWFFIDSQCPETVLHDASELITTKLKYVQTSNTA
jgi:tRNA dimethylallyltransferase